MTRQMLESILGRAGCVSDGDGRWTLPDARTMTLYLSRDGASLQVGRVVEIAMRDSIVEALDHKGELFMLGLEDLFAASVSGDARSGQARKAGFLG
jgi:hypothetical protein